MPKHKEGQSQRMVLSPILSTSPGAAGSLPSLLNKSTETQSTSLGQAHLQQGKQVHRECKYILTSYRNTFGFPCFPHHLKPSPLEC